MTDRKHDLNREQALANVRAALDEMDTKRDWERRRLGLATDAELLEWQLEREQETRDQAHLDIAPSLIDWPALARARDESQPRNDGCDELRLDFRELLEIAIAELQAYARG